MRVLITQSAQDAPASALRARGHEVVSVPLIVAERVPEPKINLSSAQAFLVTGAEGARAGRSCRGADVSGFRRQRCDRCRTTPTGLQECLGRQG